MAKEKESEVKEKAVTKTKPRKGWKIAQKIAIGVIILALAGLVAYLYKQNNDLKKNPISSQEAQQQENKRIIESVGKLYSLPQDEEPTIFFVSDKDKLSEDYKKQEFFQKAENGDYILIYEKGKIALLYRPSENRLVDVRPYTVQTSLSVALLGPEASRTAAEKLLSTAFKSEVSVVARNDAKSNYSGVVVVDTTGNYGDQVKKIAETLKGKVGNLPEGENKPDGADIVVLVGGTATQAQ